MIINNTKPSQTTINTNKQTKGLNKSNLRLSEIQDLNTNEPSNKKSTIDISKDIESKLINKKSAVIIPKSSFENRQTMTSTFYNNLSTKLQTPDTGQNFKSFYVNPVVNDEKSTIKVIEPSQKDSIMFNFKSTNQLNYFGNSNSNTSFKDYKKKEDNKETRVFVIKKLEWNKTIQKEVDKGFNDVEKYLHEAPNIIINKPISGPRHSDPKSLSSTIIVPHSIVGSVSNYIKYNPQFGQKKNFKPVKGKQKQSMKKQSTSLMIRTFQDKQTRTGGDNNNNGIYSNEVRTYVDDETITKLFRKIKERVINNKEKEYASRQNSMCNSAKGDEEQDMLLLQSKLKNDLHTNSSRSEHNKETLSYNDDGDVTTKNIKKNSHNGGNRFGSQIQSPIKRISAFNGMSGAGVDSVANNMSVHNVIKYNPNEKEEKMINELRRKLEENRVKFVKKIYSNRMKVDTKLGVPVEIQAGIQRQNKVLNSKEDQDVFKENLTKAILRKTNKSPDKLLINTIEEQRWKSEVKKIIDENITFEDKLGVNQWMASLRRPFEFEGERLAYFNSGQYWHLVREKKPENREVVLPGLEIDKDQEEILLTKSGFKSLNNKLLVKNKNKIKEKSNNGNSNGVSNDVRRELSNVKTNLKKINLDKENENKDSINNSGSVTSYNDEGAEKMNYKDLKEENVVEESRRKGLAVTKTASKFNKDILSKIKTPKGASDNIFKSNNNQNDRHRGTFLNIENQSILSFVAADNKRVKPVNKMIEMGKNRLRGKSLLDFEISNFRTMHGQKILYNRKINPATQKEYLPEEKKETIFLADYSNNLKVDNYGLLDKFEKANSHNFNLKNDGNLPNLMNTNYSSNFNSEKDINSLYNTKSVFNGTMKSDMNKNDNYYSMVKTMNKTITNSMNSTKAKKASVIWC